MQTGDPCPIPEEQVSKVYDAIRSEDGPVGWDRLTDRLDLDGDSVDAGLRVLERENRVRYSAVLEGYVETDRGDDCQPTDREQEAALRVLAHRDDLLGAIAALALEREYGDPVTE